MISKILLAAPIVFVAAILSIPVVEGILDAIVENALISKQQDAPLVKKGTVKATDRRG